MSGTMRRSFVVIVAAVGCAAGRTPEASSAPSAGSSVPSASIVVPGEAAPSASASVSVSASASASAPPKYVVVATSNPPIVELVTFEKGSAKVRAESKALLDEIANVLVAHPEIELLQIEGHAIAGESAQISQSRADAVRDALVARGIDTSRLRARGFAAHCPRFPGADPRNRRVELKVAKVSGAARDGLGCEAATAAGVVSDPVP